jgi:hypothetical protein
MNSTRQLNKTYNDQFATQLRTATAMFCRFLSLQYRLGDSFLKSFKDLIHLGPAALQGWGMITLISFPFIFLFFYHEKIRHGIPF